VLFPDLKGHEMVIPAVPLDDNIVSKAREGALNLLRCNFPGPKKCVVLTDYFMLCSLSVCVCELTVDTLYYHTAGILPSTPSTIHCWMGQPVLKLTSSWPKAMN